MKCEFLYLQYYDLIFHVMAYFKVSNASNLYDVQYIAKMADEKAGFAYDIISDVKALQEYYNMNYERLMIISFLPYYCNSYEEMKNRFLTYNRFTQEDLHFFIKPFIKMLDNESKFFFQYWQKINAIYESLKYITENRFINELEKYSCVFDYFDKPCKILFSYNITRNGRGFYSDSHFAALIPFPQSSAAFNYSFIQLLHEYTHNFTDNLLNKNISMEDGSHSLSEDVAILADYYLIKTIDESFITVYFDWIKNCYDEDFDEIRFLYKFDINENLKVKLMKLIKNILELYIV